MILREQNPDRKGGAKTYLITWVCYGTWFPGQSGAVPRAQNQFGAPLPEPDCSSERQSIHRMAQRAYLLDAFRRQVVLESLQRACFDRGWKLWAAHVRSNHVHVVTTANRPPESVMNAMKAYSSHALNEHGLDGPGRRRWARHGSTRYLWTLDAAQAAIEYVVRQQGEPMAVFELTSLQNADPGRSLGPRGRNDLPSLTLRVL